VSNYLIATALATIMSNQGNLYFVLNPCNATTLSHKSNQNVPENDKNWIEIVVMAIIYT